MSGPHGQPLDLAPLHGALPSMNGHVMSPPAAHASARLPDFEASFKAPQHPERHFAGPGAMNNAWSNDFLTAPSSGPQSHAQAMSSSRLDSSRQAMTPGYTTRPNQGYQPRFGHAQSMYRPSPMEGIQQNHLQQSEVRTLPASVTDDKVWSEAFTAYDSEGQVVQPQAQQLPPEAQQIRPETTPFEADELAKTAGKLVSSVEHDKTDKFQNSAFLNLMKKLRDREAGIQGTNIVDNVQGSRAEVGADVKGKGKAIDGTSSINDQALQEKAAAYLRSRGATTGDLQMPAGMQESYGQDRSWLNEMWAEDDARSEAIEEKARQRAARSAFVGDGGDTAARMREDDAEAREFAKYQSLNAGVLGAQSRLKTGWEEDIDQASREDFVGRRWEGTKGRGVRGAQAAEWDKLQADWDAFEAGPSGLRSSLSSAFTAANVPRYQFQQDNPYLQTTRTHAMHSVDVSADIRSILESEAAVQQDPTDSEAWYNLGVKQQENERESSAIAALHRALQINPLMKEAWLALAVSYTNENDKAALYESIEKWIQASQQYSDVVAAHRASLREQSPQKGRARSSTIESSSSTSSSFNRFGEQHDRIVSTLLAMARHGSGTSQVDADVQVALGVLFNATDDFAKAVDCFGAAISSRPDDWLLYNRLGAVLSNSGRSEEALHYYRYALELKPDFARCHFNLAISCLNLKMHEEAASHCFTALTLQQVDQRQQQRYLGSGNGSGGSTGGGAGAGGQGENSHSLWETLRISLDLGGRHELADRTRSRNLDLFDPADFAGPDGGAGAGGGGMGMDADEYGYGADADGDVPW